MSRPRLDDDSQTVRETYTMPLELVERFNHRTDEMRLSKSEVVRELLEVWLKRTAAAAPERRIYDRAKKRLMR